MSDTPTIADLTTAYQEAQADLTAYVNGIEAAHHELYPNPVRPDGRPQWSSEQADLRTAAWTEEQIAEVGQLREAARAAVVDLWRAREGGGA